MWSEEEMRDIPEVAEELVSAPPLIKPRVRISSRGYADSLRRELSARNLSHARGSAHEVSRGSVPSVIYAPSGTSHGNFIAASYDRICAEPQWARRLQKAHTSKRQARPQGAEEVTRAWCELDSSMSSDALLMNIFCYPRALAGKPLPHLLGVGRGLVPEFGFKPRVALQRGLKDASEIDMRLGNLLVEAKLTESDFQCAPMSRLERYAALDEVFERELLPVTNGQVESYQLIRGVLAAAQLGLDFCVLCDARRGDLRESWFLVIRAVRGLEMQARCKLLTWQEVAGCVPGPLRVFLDDKYGIRAG